jgi:hypothetical protein
LQLFPGPGGTSVANPTFNRTISADLLTPSNTAPVVVAEIETQHALPKQPYHFTIPSGTFFDPDPGDVLACRAHVPRVALNPDGTSTPYNDSLPAWLTFSSPTFTFSGTPAFADVETITVVLICEDIYGMAVATAYELRVWALSFKRGFPRVKLGTQGPYSIDLEIAFDINVTSRVNSMWQCNPFPRGVVPLYRPFTAIEPIPIPDQSPVNNSKLLGYVTSDGSVQVVRLDMSAFNVDITTVDVYCAFTVNVAWWFQDFTVVSQVVRARPVGVIPSGIGFFPGFPRMVDSSITTSAVTVEVYFYADTRSKRPNYACYSVPRGTTGAVDSFGKPVSPQLGMFTAEFVPGELLSGSVNTGATLITTSDIYCTYFDLDLNVWVVRGPMQPSVGMSTGFPRIKTNTTSWDRTIVEVKLEAITRSASDYVVCHLVPRDAKVTWDPYGLPTPPPILSASTEFVTNIIAEIYVFSGATNMTYADIYCGWQDTNGVWQISAPLKPALGFSQDYPHVIPGNFASSNIITTEVMFGTETSMPYNATFLCWSFLRTAVSVARGTVCCGS